jgi:hypothetical protein
LAGPDELAATLRFGQFPDAVIETRGGTWRIETPARGEGDEGAPVRGEDGATVARIAYSRGPHRVTRHTLFLAGGEQVTFVSEAGFMSQRYRLGDDLFVASPNWFRPFREFTAALSPELARRPDRVLLVALASVLTHWRISGGVYPPSYVPYK